MNQTGNDQERNKVMTMKFSNLLYTVFLSTFFIAIAIVSATASEHKNQEDSTSTDSSIPEKKISKIQLPGLWIPTYNSRGVFRKMTLLTANVTFDPKDFKNVCVNIPYITDRLIVYINKNPIPKKDFNDKKIKELADVFLKELHTKIGIKSIHRVILERGDIKRTDDEKLISTACNSMRPATIRGGQ